MLQKIKQIISTNIIKKTVILPLVFAIVFLCIAASLSSVNTFVVYEGDNISVYNSDAKTTAEALAEMEIVIDETKYAEMPDAPEHGDI